MRGERGLTLLELVAAMAIFALVAVMGLQTLGGMLRARDGIAGASDEAATLARALALLRADLKAAANLRFWPPEAFEPAPPLLDRSAEEGWFALSTEGRAVLPEAQTAGTERVIWRHDRAEERLLRAVWPVMRPASEAALSPETQVLDRVSGLRLRAYAGPEEGWVAGWGQPDEDTRLRLPRAIEVTLESELYGPIVILVALP